MGVLDVVFEGPGGRNAMTDLTGWKELLRISRLLSQSEINGAVSDYPQRGGRVSSPEPLLPF